MKTIKIFNSDKYFTVDDEDYEKISKFKWYINKKKGYVFRNEHIYLAYKKYSRPTIYLAREIMGLQKGIKFEVDHINHDKLNNKRNNLKVCEHWQNVRNRLKLIKYKVSQYRGVSFVSKNRWMTRICFEGKVIYLGTSPTELEASQAYQQAELKYHKNSL